MMAIRSPYVTLCVAAFLTVLSSSIAVAQTDKKHPPYERIFAGTNISIPVETYRERQFARVIRQEKDFSCGSAALATLLTHHYGIPRTERDLFTVMFEIGDQDSIRQRGFSLLDMQSYLKREGLVADGYAMDLEKVMQVGVPGIALIDVNGYKHFVVIKGVKDNRVLIGDPSTGLVVRSKREFEASWDGTILFIRSNVAQGKASWNMAEDWRAHPVGRPIDGPTFSDLQQETLHNTRVLNSGFNPISGF
ncbi:MAG: C39 family peptidase [Pseudomonadota bacterium]